MKRFATVLFFLLFFSALDVNAQDVQLDTLDLPSLPELFYKDQTFLNKTYDYQLIVKRDQYKRWSRDVLVIGLVTVLSEMAVGGILYDKYNWSGWVYFPCATLVSSATIFPFIKWSRNLSKKADAVSLELSCFPNVGMKISF